MSAGVAITANDRHSRLRQSQLRANDVDDALFSRIDIKELNVELAAILPERVDLCSGNRIGNRQTAIGRRNVVIGSGNCQVWTANALGPQRADPQTPAAK